MDEPGAEITNCPCFNLLNILETGENSKSNFCDNTIWGLLLTFQNENDGEFSGFSASCLPDGTSCQCQMGSLNTQNGIDISADEVGVCMNNIINGIIRLTTDNVSIGCTFVQ